MTNPCRSANSSDVANALAVTGGKILFDEAQ
jgi:hypothetical protein